MAQSTTTSSILTQQHFVRPIPFKAHKISGFTPELFERYYEDIYGGSVRALNDVEAIIAAARQAGSPKSELPLLVCQQAALADLIVLHELFLAGLGEDGGEELDDDDLARALVEGFGGIANWKAEFALMAASQGDTPGWVILVWCERFGQLLNVATQDGRLALCSSVPILALDLREHVYASDFGSDRQAYINAYINSIHWGRIAEGLRNVRRVRDHVEEISLAPGLISVAELKGMMENAKDTPLVLDVRHDDDRERFTARIAGTDWRDSFHVADWAGDLPKDKPVVVYCMYGFWVSQKVAEELRAEGIDARSLEGGVTAWRAMGLPSSENDV